MIINVIDNDEIRIDKYLIDKIDISRSKIQKLIEEEKILVNDKVVKASYVVKLDDVIYVDENYEEKIEILPQDIKINIVYEDDDIAVINKESGMVVHPAPGNYSNTLVNALMYHFNNLSSVNGNIRPGIVHRIDALTSGLLVIAKNDKSHLFLANLLQTHDIKRTYIALVEGIIEEDTATIDAPIGRDKNNRKKMCVTSDNSKDAITHLRVLKRFKDSTLIECNLETGRSHQIRVHMNYINHPIVNDPVYGKKVIDADFGQMLHAYKIEFMHPTKKELMIFSCETPKRFNEILQEYENH